MSETGIAGLRPPPGCAAPPPFDCGWTADDGAVEPFLSYVDGGEGANWSTELETLHDKSSRDHPIDVWTRRATVARLGRLSPGAVVVDLGCSTGFLLQDLRVAYPYATLVGIDLIAAGLTKAHASVPEARLMRADACELPLADESVDAAVSLNLLEHIPEDERALAELRRVLRPGAGAVLVVPAGPPLYDYYDRFLAHQRRYATGELAEKARRAHLEVIDDLHLGSLLYPAFWLVKQRNRRSRGHLRGSALEAQVRSDIGSTAESRVVRLGMRLEQPLLDRGLRIPFGIRGLTVVRRPRSVP